MPEVLSRPTREFSRINDRDVIDAFVKSRREGLSPKTIKFYQGYLNRAIPSLSVNPDPKCLNNYFNSLSCSIGGKHAYYRAISVFFNWLYSPKSGFHLRIEDNPIICMEPPKKPKLILPSLTKEQVLNLIQQAHCIRDKAIISLFTESGLRLSELVNIKNMDIDWQGKTIKVLGKGNKEAFVTFGSLTESYLKQWLNEYHPEPKQRIWNLEFWGVKSFLDTLKRETGLPCNPHTFRRTFACLLRKAGLDSLTIKDLGRWESLEMVQRYTRSITFQDSMKLYKAPLS